ncbi:CO dehydrogenase flavoprotein C-terminal domain [Acididesulfobacillus acetoxydans]|uniref:CO dehydrogenase flavoprotein C-terminal domain n=1 Tax=Acididesulfobacillus acetoxydans TaxID=1561005 RepID=A0A8S0X447_9FIRM|nr:FAD binding domain-containing protein [Acididesulfobacillus acetoxydans]CAA7600560.1 CO dehydrogenase flavoprotein C-terminal domain [Acididesulfobacillus acetoxydans]CEJ06694.1 FAD binding domain in molybdopterin dehydrogenase protein [Acididesulfobacillus acetoxydans]
MMHKFRMACPDSVAETLELLAGMEGEIAYLGGGTDLVPQMQDGRRQPDWVVDLSQIPELACIRFDGERIRLGSTATFTQIAGSALIEEQGRCLAQAAGQVGSVQIRNRATLGGNIASASPAGDSLPVLLALDAKLTVLGPAGERRISFERFQIEPGEGLRRGELIAGIDFAAGSRGHTGDGRHVPADKSDFSAGGRHPIRVSAFGKIGSRQSVTIAKLNMAAFLEMEPGEGIVVKSRLALGALGRHPFRLRNVEEEMRGRRLDDSLIVDVTKRLQEVVDGAIPGRYSQTYKRQAIRGLAADVFGDLQQQVSVEKASSSNGPDQGGGKEEQEIGC